MVQASCSKRMCKLVSVSVDYMLGKRYISCGITHKQSALPSGQTQHVRRMCSSIGSVINSILEFRSAHFFYCYHTLILTGDGSYILGNVSYPFFSAMTENTVIGYLLESPLPLFKKFRLLFYNYCVFARFQIKIGNILLLHSSLFISYSAETFPR